MSFPMWRSTARCSAITCLVGSTKGVAIQQSEVRLLPRMESLLRAAAQRSMLRLSELDKHFPNRPARGEHRVRPERGRRRVPSAKQQRPAALPPADPVAPRRERHSTRPSRLPTAGRASASSGSGERACGRGTESSRLSSPGSTIWVLAAILVVFAYRKRRRYHHAKLREMEYRERLESLAATSQPPPAPLSTPAPAAEVVTDKGVPIVEHDGKSHTLH